MTLSSLRTGTSASAGLELPRVWRNTRGGRSRPRSATGRAFGADLEGTLRRRPLDWLGLRCNHTQAPDHLHQTEMANSIQTYSGDWDPSQFKLQPDGTFRISIRGMAAMAGVDDGALSRSLKSAAAENALPCARSLLAQGFSPAAVSTWGETGGIPEDAAPFVLEHYGITAASPSAQARAVLLAFSRVGINAYLKERLGVSQVRDTQPELVALPVEAMLTTLERAAILMEQFGGLDDRDQLLFRDLTRNTVLRAAGSTIALPPAPEDEELTLSDAWLEVTGSPLPRRDGPGVGRLVAALYREEFDKEPPTRTQYVDGAPRQVKSYKRGWLVEAVKAVWSRVSA